MGTFILIHGSWHGGWCWNKVVPLLEREGHKAFAPDLPGHGKDATPLQRITLQSYVDSVCRTIDSQAEPIVLVGHSMGGIVISQTAELRPSKIRRLVYLSAFLLRNGESMLAVDDSDSLISSNLLFSDDRKYHIIKDDSMVKEIFYGDCSDADVARAKRLLVREPTVPIETPLRLSEENYGRVPRQYIGCRRDKAVSPMLQQKMYTAMPCENLILMDTSHSPFFSKPEELVAHLSATLRSV